MQTFPPNFLVRKFSVNGQFPRIFGQTTQKSAETVRLRLIRKLGRKAYILHGEEYKQLISKIYSFNNIVTLY